MKNIYDILVNFKKIPYEFYEWNKEDDVKHVKKMPSIKVSDSALYDIFYNDAVVSKNFLDQIKDKTEIFFGRTVKKVKYACVIYNDDVALSILLNDNGEIIGKSKLLFDEEEDVLKEDVPLKEIDYNVIKKVKKISGLTRREAKIVLLLSKYLDKIHERKKNEEIRYKKENEKVLSKMSEDIYQLEHNLRYILMQVKLNEQNKKYDENIELIDQYIRNFGKFKAIINTDNPYFDYFMILLFMIKTMYSRRTASRSGTIFIFLGRFTIANTISIISNIQIQ